MSSFSPESTASSPVERKLRHHLDRRRRLLGALEDLLRAQQRAIVAGDIDTMGYHAALERDTLDDLRALETVITAMRVLLPHVVVQRPDDLLTNASQHQRRNRELLAHRIEETSRELHHLCIPRSPRQVYRRAHHGGAMVDITR